MADRKVQALAFCLHSVPLGADPIPSAQAQEPFTTEDAEKRRVTRIVLLTLLSSANLCVPCGSRFRFFLVFLRVLSG